MALQAGVLPVEAGFQVPEALIDMCLEPDSHLLNQIRSRVKATIHLRLSRVEATIHFRLSRVKAATDLVIGHEASVAHRADWRRAAQRVLKRVGIDEFERACGAAC